MDSVSLNLTQLCNFMGKIKIEKKWRIHKPSVKQEICPQYCAASMKAFVFKTKDAPLCCLKPWQ